MSIRQKTLLIIVVLLTISSVVTFYAFIQFIWWGGYARLEEQQARQNVERVLAALSAELTGLNSTTHDWAAWDETYDFVAGLQPSYVTENLSDSAFATLRLSLLLYLDQSGQVVYGRAFDLENGQALPLPASLVEYLARHNSLLRHPTPTSSQAGIILLPEGPFLVVARPIVNNDDQGPIRGTLIMGRKLQIELDRLSNIFQLPLRLNRLDRAELAPDLQAARLALAADESSPYVAALNSDFIAGYTRLPDINGQPVVLLGVDMPRDISKQGWLNLLYFISSLLVISLGFGGLIWLLLERGIISRLAFLERSVREVAAGADLSARVSLAGHDELNRLAATINDMLTSLEQAQAAEQAQRKARRKSEQQYQRLFQQANDAFMVFEPDHETVLEVNSRACEIYGFSREEFIGMNLQSISHDIAGGREKISQIVTEGGISNAETIQFRKDRIPLHLLINAVSTEYNGQPAILSINRDIGEQKQAEEALRRYAARLQVLHEIDRDILTAQLPEATARVALGHILRLVPCQYACLVEFPPGIPVARVMATSMNGSGGRSITGAFVRPEEIGLEFLRQGQVHQVTDMANLSQWSSWERVLQGYGICSYVNVPMTVGDELTGALSLGAMEPGGFTDEALDIAREVATSLAVAIRHAHLYEQNLRDAETKTLLLDEVNHRVKNNLAAIIGLLYLEQHREGPGQEPAYQDMLKYLRNRIQGLAAVHGLLAAAGWDPLPLSDLVGQVINSSLQILPADKQVFKDISPSPIRVNSIQAVSLALVVNELTTNTIRYALEERQAVWLVTRIKQVGSMVQLEFCDDGPGYPAGVVNQREYRVGLYLVQNIVQNELRGELTLTNDGGAVASIRFNNSVS